MHSGTLAAVLDSNPRDSLQLYSETEYGLKMKTTSSERTSLLSNGDRRNNTIKFYWGNSTNWSVNS